MTLPGTNETLREALQDVNTPNLLLVLATITGDDLWLSERYAPAPVSYTHLTLPTNREV